MIKSLLMMAILVFQLSLFAQTKNVNLANINSVKDAKAFIEVNPKSEGKLIV